MIQKSEIYQKILRQAAEYWRLPPHNIEQNVDPLVRFIAGALAVELEHAYNYLNDSELRIQNQLTRSLLPEDVHFPTPAHALATAAPELSEVAIQESLQLCVKDDQPMVFAPIQPTRLLKVRITNAKADGAPITSRTKIVTELSFKLETSTQLIDWQQISLYLGFAQQGFSQTEIFLNGQKMKVNTGFPALDETHLETCFQSDALLKQLVLSIYESRFLTISSNIASTDVVETLQIRFAQPVVVQDLETHLKNIFNVFPVVNRAWNEVSQFVPKNQLKCLHLQPKMPFAGLQAVTVGGKKVVFRPIATFGEQQALSYTIRYGGLGSKDNYNVWQRLSYLLQVVQREQNDNWLEKMGNTLSLEELHQILDQKVKNARVQTPLQDIYVLVHSDLNNGNDFKVQYWTSMGAAANGFHANTALNTLDTNLKPDSIRLLTPSQGGKAVPNETALLEQLRGRILHNGRLVTKADIESFCRIKFGNQIKKVYIGSTTGMEPRFQQNIIRFTEVVLTLDKDAQITDNDLLQLQIALEKQSCSAVPFKIRVND
jgi:hypothetical protein